MPDDSNWLPGKWEQSQGIRLFCFPHAGGGSALFHRWEKILPGHIAVLPVKLPGRESRFNEVSFDSLPALLNAITPALADAVREPFALFGHSMGGLIAYEFAQRLHKEHGKSPMALFASACRSPDRIKRTQSLHRLPDEEMIQSLIRDFNVDGKASESETEMMRVMVDTIRADLKLLETYEYKSQPPLPCPIIGLAASEDKKVTAADVNGWRAFTTERFTMRTVPGHHFFLRAQEKSVTDLIASKLVL